ncbi:30S ribosomal protein S16 [Alphaproteobacteria bacterium]
MAVKMRLARKGKKGAPCYSVVIANDRSPRDGKFIEKVGDYYPLLPTSSEKRATFKQERVQYWLSVGAQPTERVAKLLQKYNVVQIN